MAINSAEYSAWNSLMYSFSCLTKISTLLKCHLLER